MLAFSTMRLRVRPIRLADAPTMAAYRSDPDVARWVPWEPPYPVEKASELIGRMVARTGITWGEWTMMAIERVGDGVMVGDCVAKMSAPEQNQAEIGYILARDHHGQGLATEVVRGLITELVRTVGLHRITAYVHVDNRASQRVLEKLGLRREAHLVEAHFTKGEWASEYIYAVLAREWTG